MFRSGTSVAANYREAYRACSRAEFISKLGDSQKELEEMILWLELIGDSNTMKATKLTLLMAESNELMPIITSIIKNSKD